MALPIWQRTITTEAGDVIPGAEVEVVNEATGLAADIFSNRSGITPRTNPFFTGADGFAQFYAAPGEYRITATGPTGLITWRWNVLTGDIATQNANTVAITGGTASLNTNGLTVGTDQLVTSGGNVLVSTTSSAITGNRFGSVSRFAVSGGVGRVQVSDTGNEIAFSRDGFNYISAFSGSDASFVIGAQSSLLFATGASANLRMRINSAGNVTIGEGDAVGKLDVSGGFIYARAGGFAANVEQIRIGRDDANSRYHSIYSTISSDPNTSALAIRIHDGVTGESQNEVVKFFGNGQQASVIPGGSTLFNEYKCRGWVNFDGGNGGIRSSGNVSSVTKIGAGDYRVNFATPMPNNNYSVSVSSSRGGTTNDANTVAQICRLNNSVLAGSVRLITGAPGTVGQPRQDDPIVTCAIFR